MPVMGKRSNARDNGKLPLMHAAPRSRPMPLLSKNLILAQENVPFPVFCKRLTAAYPVLYNQLIFTRRKPFEGKE